jgi:hypothetical protein
MRNYEGLAAAADAIREFYYTNKAELPEFVRDKIAGNIGQGNSPVELAVNFTETIFANRDVVPSEAMEIAAGVAMICHEHGFHQDLNGRAYAIVQALRRDSGERAPNGSGGWPKKEDDPGFADTYRRPVRDGVDTEEAKTE